MGTSLKEYTKIDLYSMGYSPKEIARIKGLTVKEVEDWIRRNGIRRKKDMKENIQPKNRKEKMIRELISW